MSTFKHNSAITPEMIEELKAMVGQRLQIEQYNHEATFDTIRHYAFGIGDDNPLWCDPAYAAKSRYGAIVAPPTFFYSVFAPGIAPGLSGLQPFQAGGDCVWRRLAKRGEGVKAEAHFVGFDEHKGSHAGRMIIEIGRAHV